MSILASIAPIQTALDYHLSRHNILTSNLANVDTPGHRAQDLYRTGPFDTVLQMHLQVTDARHLGQSARPVDWRVQIDPNAPVGPDGNSVSLDREAVKIASNTLRYDALSGMIRGKLNGLQWAAQGGR
jgi:flagellar basal-body rod protein FlgB